MTRFAVTFLVSLSLAAATHADELVQPGQWKVTSSTVIDGAVQSPQAKMRCISAEQAADLGKTFGPVAGTVNSTCEDPQIETSAHGLQWRLECRGQLDMDVAASFDFDTPQHYTAIIVSKGRMAGTVISDVTSKLEGERVGECAQ